MFEPPNTERVRDGEKMTDEAFVQAITEFKAANIAAANVGTDVCVIYRRVKPILSGILPLLKLVPVYGATISEALTALMSVLDNICPVSDATSPGKS
jgi:hypothetical protein